ncbi:MAG: NotI family restriction endonuclease [Thermodesulfobacteriota bacterium]|nr:NotI family restriction endonuclease [Thermodesulfobacteriota bacterium]
MGVCSIYHENRPVITCPIRFREDWIITDDAASFFFEEGTTWSSLTEVRLNDLHGKSAGNVDVVLVAYDKNGKVYDFGALEIQAVYISGNVRTPFEHFIEDPRGRASMNWSKEPNYPRPDYLSSSRKRLAPQLLFKGGILHSWGKKTAVALNRGLFNTLPKLHEAAKNEADIVWMVYDVVPGIYQNSQASRQMKLVMHKAVYSKWPEFLNAARIPIGEDITVFSGRIDAMLDDVAV